MKTESSTPSTLGHEEIELEKNKQNLSELVARRSAYFQQDGEDSNKKSDDKKNFIGEFLAPYLENFGMLKKSWSEGDVARNTGAIADYFVEKFDSLMEKYLPSSPQEKNNFEKFRNKILRAEDPNKIKLESGENLIDQLKEKGVNLQEINDQVKQMALINPFSKDDQSIPIKLKDGRTLNLDVKQYAEDLFEHNQLQKNTDANSRNGSQTQQIELSGPLALYGKQKFNEKFPKDDVVFKEDKESIEALQNQAQIFDQKREETLKKFAEKFGLTLPENKSQTSPKQPENKASETLQSTEPQQEANHVKPKISPLQGILKKDKAKQENLESSLSKKVGFEENEVQEYSPQNPPSWTNRVTAKGKSGDLEKSR